MPNDGDPEIDTRYLHAEDIETIDEIEDCTEDALEIIEDATEEALEATDDADEASDDSDAASVELPTPAADEAADDKELAAELADVADSTTDETALEASLMIEDAASVALESRSDTV